MGFFEKLKQGLTKTKQNLMGGLSSLFTKSEITDDFYDELEETLILSDLGGKTAEDIVDSLKSKVKENKLKTCDECRDALKEIISDMLGEDTPLDISTTPSVILVIGVNGVGKTTSIAKIANLLKKEGKKVILAAADTFRAAAADQLQIWSERAGVDLIRQSEGSDPAAVVFDAVNAAKNRHADVLIVDTAGRLQNKKNLMDELAKISRVIDRELPGCAKETLLVLDATTGQNAVSQAKEFGNAAEITGLIVTKLDGTAKGGIVFSIKNELGIPVKFICVGEQIDDLEKFSPEDFVKAMFEN